MSKATFTFETEDMGHRVTAVIPHIMSFGIKGEGIFINTVSTGHVVEFKGEGMLEGYENLKKAVDSYYENIAARR